MKAFPRLSLIYETWQKFIESTNVVTMKFATEVLTIDRSKKNVVIRYREVDGTDLGQLVVPAATEKEVKSEVFDELILGCDASASLKLLGSGASFLEKKILGNVKVSASPLRPFAVSRL